MSSMETKVASDVAAAEDEAVLGYLEGAQEGLEEEYKFWVNLQQEQGAWQVKNFGEGHKHWPLLGLIEELGELQDSLHEESAATLRRHVIDESAFKDAVGDIFIYATDVCNKWGWNLAHVVGLAKAAPRPVKRMAVALGKLAHAQLKYEQGIRGSKQEYEDKVLAAVVTALSYPIASSAKRDIPLEQTVDEVWAKVSKRDWVANPVNAAKIVDEQHGG